MIVRNNRYITMAIAGMLLVTTVSCDFFVDDTKGDFNEVVDSAEVKLNQKEASLLVAASRSNVNIIKLSEFLNERTEDTGIVNLSKQLIDNHTNIAQNFNKVAETKLISIPNISNDFNINSLESSSSNIDSKVLLEKIKQLLNSQLESLNQLSKSTNDTDFKNLVKDVKAKLRYNLDLTNKLLAVKES